MEQQGENVAEIGRATWLVRGCGCLAIFVVAAAILSPSLTPAHSGRRFSCANNMKQIGLGLKMYSNEEQGEFMPSLAIQPGRLMFPVDSMFPEYQPEAAIQLCPKDADFSRFAKKPFMKDDGYGYGRLRDNIDPKKMFDDWSYFYLGYAVVNDEDVERFAVAYREHIASGISMNADITEANDPSGERTIYRLAEGIERKLLTRFGYSLEEPGASSRVQSDIPLLIERAGNHTGKESGRKYSGANILYLDGHVEFIDYPAKWPMTEKTVRILNELDALGDVPPTR